MCEETEGDAVANDEFDYIGFGSTWQKARKGHVCEDCPGIKPGQLYIKHTFIFEGEWGVSRHCASCWHDSEWLTHRGHHALMGVVTQDYNQCRDELDRT